MTPIQPFVYHETTLCNWENPIIARGWKRVEERWKNSEQFYVCILLPRLITIMKYSGLFCLFWETNKLWHYHIILCHLWCSYKFLFFFLLHSYEISTLGTKNSAERDELLSHWYYYIFKQSHSTFYTIFRSISSVI